MPQYWLIRSKRKWSTFLQRNFDICFVPWKWLCFYSNFTDICSQFTIRQYWCRSWLDNETGDKSLFEPMMALVTDGYVHYSDVIMSVMASQITCVLICSAVDQRKHQRSATLAFVKGIQRWPVDSPNKSPATRIMFSFDDVIMSLVVISWRMCALVGPNDLKLGLMFCWCTDCQ